ncbi:MAG TPA: hypothetical protein P5205_01570 [Candidatus Paceibacterota bacterium]|nr:hypothetical protein [Verrucomicrobiota bacterium]HSA09035.1 hypothetical protein [Candidatus Paceibacterota bacterium]
MVIDEARFSLSPGRFLSSVARTFLVVLCASGGLGAEELLPEGDAPAALESRHFPDRVHEFVWRNWQAVEPAKLAKILGASKRDITALATSMGLPPGAKVPRELRERGYITLIRRNWHLLPYEQLLELLEMTPERLAFMLREEDFLWIKLGRLKPRCEPLRYRPPDEAARRRAAEIRRLVEADFGEELRRPAEARFEFVRQLSRPMGPASQKPVAGGPRSLRLVYSYVALYGDPLLNPRLDPYPDGLLERFSAAGINGVWLHVVLRDLAPGGTTFPEFGAGHERRLSNLRALVKRARKHGVGVYLYLNEPRAMPAAFFKQRPALAGVREGESTALCTAQPTVRQWMEDALAFVFEQVPGLGGVYTITASENLTSCASHGDWRSCERCKARSDADIISEVAAVIEAGVHRGNAGAHVLLSDWGWRGHGSAPDIIARLPKSVWLMSVSEWSLPIERGGIKSTVGEYSISSVGPGPRALAHWQAAQAAGLKTGAEIQFNNTCEIASLPYLPVMDLVAAHCHKLTSATRLDAMLIGWTMGGYPSPNLQLAERLTRTPAPEPDKVLDALARERFGPAGAPHARKAWTLMSDAFCQYPFHISVVYTSPVQRGPANPLYPVKTGYKATMWGIPYDDLDGWRGPYPPEVFAAQFEKIVAGWQPGIAELRLAVEKSSPCRRREIEADLRLAQAAAIHFQSVANQARFILARDALARAPATIPPETRHRLRAEVARCLESEISLARQLFTLTRQDSRIGFEPSCQYFYLPLDLVEKVIACRWLLGQFN